MHPDKIDMAKIQDILEEKPIVYSKRRPFFMFTAKNYSPFVAVFVAIGFIFAFLKAPELGTVLGVLLMLASAGYTVWNYMYTEFLKTIDINARLAKCFDELKKLYELVIPDKMKVCGDLPERCRDIVCNHFSSKMKGYNVGWANNAIYFVEI